MESHEVKPFIFDSEDIISDIEFETGLKVRYTSSGPTRENKKVL